MEDKFKLTFTFTALNCHFSFYWEGHSAIERNKLRFLSCSEARESRGSWEVVCMLCEVRLLMWSSFSSGSQWSGLSRPSRHVCDITATSRWWSWLSRRGLEPRRAVKAEGIGRSSARRRDSLRPKREPPLAPASDPRPDAPAAPPPAAWGHPRAAGGSSGRVCCWPSAGSLGAAARRGGETGWRGRHVAAGPGSPWALGRLRFVRGAESVCDGGTPERNEKTEGPSASTASFLITDASNRACQHPKGPQWKVQRSLEWMEVTVVHLLDTRTFWHAQLGRQRSDCIQAVDIADGILSVASLDLCNQETGLTMLDVQEWRRDSLTCQSQSPPPLYGLMDFKWIIY